MKAWFKKHWKDVLIIFIIVSVFGTFCILDMKRTMRRRAMHKANLESLEYIEKRVTEILEACPPRPGENK